MALIFVTETEVARWLGMAKPDAHLPVAVAATNAYLNSVGHLTEVTDAVKAGAIMLAARLHRRRNSTGGIESMDGAPAYVSRSDPDIARLLGLDQNAPLQIG